MKSLEQTLGTAKEPVTLATAHGQCKHRQLPFL